MIKTIRVLSAPAGILWNKPLTSDIVQYTTNTYVNTGKLISSVVHYNADNTLQTTTYLWKSAADRDEYFADPFLVTSWHQLKNKYELDNNITEVSSEITEIAPNDIYVLENYTNFVVVRDTDIPGSPYHGVIHSLITPGPG